jgi:Na+-driven multidrug efflux pump
MVTGCGAAGLNFVIGVLDGVVCKIGLSVLFAYGLGMGANGFFWGISLSRLLPAIICIIYYYSGRWARRSLVKK